MHWIRCKYVIFPCTYVHTGVCFKSIKYYVCMYVCTCMYVYIHILFSNAIIQYFTLGWQTFMMDKYIDTCHKLHILIYACYVCTYECNNSMYIPLTDTYFSC